MNTDWANMANAYLAFLKLLLSPEKLTALAAGVIVILFILRGRPLAAHILNVALGLFLSSAALFVASTLDLPVPERAQGWLVVGFALIWSFVRGVKGKASVT